MNLWAIFLTGLLTGGLTCLAVQGGLLAATIAQRSHFVRASKDKEDELKQKLHSGNALPIISFLIAKLVAYTILGFLLGWFGSFFQLSFSAQVAMQFAVGIFMLGTALNILNVHPIFRYFVIQPPKFLTRLVRNQSKSNSLFAPILLGAFTVFIPCGTTQAMMALSIGSGSPVLGATILFVFVLGTSPLFFTLGYFATKLGNTMHQKFMKVAAYALILLALINLNGALALSGSDVTFENIQRGLYCSISFCNGALGTIDDSQPNKNPAVSDATIHIKDTGYAPNYLTIKAGSKVKLQIINDNGAGCTQAFTIPKLGIQKIVPVGSSDSISFTAPSKPGSLAFMCSMGMYKGMMNVI